MERDVAASTRCSDAKPDLPGSLSPPVLYLHSLVSAAVLKLSFSFPLLDIDENNARTAQENVKTNQLESRIRVIKTDPKDALFPLDKIEQNRYEYFKPSQTPPSNKGKASISQCATPHSTHHAKKWPNHQKVNHSNPHQSAQAPMWKWSRRAEKSHLSQK